MVYFHSYNKFLNRRELKKILLTNLICIANDNILRIMLSHAVQVNYLIEFPLYYAGREHDRQIPIVFFFCTIN